MLTTNRNVTVSIVMSPPSAQTRNFGALLILGDSNVIDVVERIRSYSSADAIATDFGINSPEYAAAALYFGQSPKPNTAYVGRWARTSTSGLLHGGILTAAQQALTNFTTITSGGFHITIDGTVKNLTALNFSAATNLNGVASIITSALASATCTWDSVLGRFSIASNSTGAGVNASGTATFSANPANNDTLTIGGTAITFVTGTPVGSQVKIGATLADTLQNLLTFVQASTDVNLILASYSVNGNVFTITYLTVGTAGNSFTLTKVSTAITVSGATLSGGVQASTVSYATSPGSGTDISDLLKLVTGVASVPIAGLTAESLAAGVAVLAGKSTAWYGLQVASSVDPSNNDILATAAYIEAASLARIYGVTTQDGNATLSTSTTDLAYLLKAAGYMRTFTQYSSFSKYATASVFGRAFSVNFNGSNTTLTLKFKQEPGVTAEDLTSSQAGALKAKNCNVFASYDNGTSILQEGVMCNGYFFDEVHDTDWLQNDLQVAVWNDLYGSTTKIPQTDAGVNGLLTTITNRLNQAVTNGMVAPGTWESDGFGALSKGDPLTKGYYVYAPPVSSQSQADRAARKAPVMQAAIKLAGAIHFADLIVNVNR